MSSPPHSLRWIGTGCAAAGSALVLVGTYLVPWISLTVGPALAMPTNLTLFQLRSHGSCTVIIGSTTTVQSCTNGLVNTASTWMTGFAILLVVGAFLLAASRRRVVTLAACAILGVASVLAILLAMHIGVLVYLSPHGPPTRIDLRQGRWICVAGGAFGLAACALAAHSAIAPVSASNVVKREPLSATRRT
jgi:hypothetical protein